MDWEQPLTFQKNTNKSSKIILRLNQTQNLPQKQQRNFQSQLKIFQHSTHLEKTIIILIVNDRIALLLSTHLIQIAGKAKVLCSWKFPQALENTGSTKTTIKVETKNRIIEVVHIKKDMIPNHMRGHLKLMQILLIIA